MEYLLAFTLCSQSVFVLHRNSISSKVIQLYLIKLLIDAMKLFLFRFAVQIQRSVLLKMICKASNPKYSAKVYFYYHARFSFLNCTFISKALKGNYRVLLNWLHILHVHDLKLIVCTFSLLEFTSDACYRECDELWMKLSGFSRCLLIFAYLYPSNKIKLTHCTKVSMRTRIQKNKKNTQLCK